MAFKPSCDIKLDWKDYEEFLCYTTQHDFLQLLVLVLESQLAEGYRETTPGSGQSGTRTQDLTRWLLGHTASLYIRRNILNKKF